MSPQSADQACVPITCLDADGDGYGVAGASSCPGGAAKIDCNDGDAAVHPGGQEVCGDGLDNDCDARADEGCLAGGKTTVYAYNAFNQLLASGKAVSCGALDRDCDGVPNVSDNCPGVYNPEQRDSDPLSTAGMVSLYKFEETSGTTVYDSVDSNHGTLTGAGSREAGKRGQGLRLSGGNVTVPDSASLSIRGPFTLEAWVKPDEVYKQQGIITKYDGYWYYDGYMMAIRYDGRMQGYSLDQSGGPAPTYASGATVLTANAWQHLATVYDGSTLKVYRNGVLDGSLAKTINPGDGVNGLKIGSYEYGEYYFYGVLDEVAVWNRALSATEVYSRYAPDGMGDACDPCPTDGNSSCQPPTCVDGDGDGYGIQGASSCPGGVDKFDCDDQEAAVHPGVADVVGDAVDNDCDGIVDGFMRLEKSYEWDGNGNMVSDGVTTYGWDARDRLVSGGYGYDTGNLRVKMGTQKVLLDGIEEAREYGASEARYDHDPSRVDGLLAQKTGAGKGYFVTDALGSVYGVVDASGAVVSKYGYDVYGARTASAEGMATGWGFTGRRHDGAGEMYYRAREYDTAAGVWTAVDGLRTPAVATQDNPWLLALGLDPVAMGNGYAFVRGSPALRTDPLGLFSPRIHRDLTSSILQEWHWRLEYVNIAANCNVDQDRWSNFFNNEQHGMSNVGQLRMDAIRKWSNYKNAQLAEAREKRCASDMAGSACALGRGLHAVQDRWAHNFITLPTHFPLESMYVLNDYVPIDAETMTMADLESWEYVEAYTFIGR